MTTNGLLPLAIAGRLITRRHRRAYIGKRRTQRTAPANHRLSPAAYQLVTRTAEQVPADVDQSTGLLDLADLHNALTGATR